MWPSNPPDNRRVPFVADVDTNEHGMEGSDLVGKSDSVELHLQLRVDLPKQVGEYAHLADDSLHVSLHHELRNDTMLVEPFLDRAFFFLSTNQNEADLDRLVSLAVVVEQLCIGAKLHSLGLASSLSGIHASLLDQILF